jgi:DNA topoisomerase-3
VSKDAVGDETIVSTRLGCSFEFIILAETFTAKGLHVKDQGWYEVYHYEKWAEHELPEFKENETFIPASLMMEEGITSPPKKLSEADLISKMDANGIGTDATIHEHIQTVQDRGYAVKVSSLFEPTNLGMALVECYEHLQVPLYKPYLRANMERDMKMVAEGTKGKVSIFSKS